MKAKVKELAKRLAARGARLVPRDAPHLRLPQPAPVPVPVRVPVRVRYAGADVSFGPRGWTL